MDLFILNEQIDIEIDFREYKISSWFSYIRHGGLLRALSEAVCNMAFAESLLHIAGDHA